MLVEMLQGKIHRATVTDCNLDYVGSLTVDSLLLDATGLRENQKIQVLNINNGQRIETYLIEGKRGSGEMVINGAAARLFQKGDLVIIAGFALYDEKELEHYRPKVIFVDGKNRIVPEPHASAR